MQGKLSQKVLQLMEMTHFTGLNFSEVKIALHSINAYSTSADLPMFIAALSKAQNCTLHTSLFSKRDLNDDND
jgi:hypothetical protein